MTQMGHEEQYPPPRLSARSASSKETFTGRQRNGEDAPKAAIGLTSIELVKPTLLRPS
jgi:hypothetical protein